MSFPETYKLRSVGDLICLPHYSDMIWEVRKIDLEALAYDCVFWGSSADANDLAYWKWVFKTGRYHDGDTGRPLFTPPEEFDARIPYERETDPNPMLVLALASSRGLEAEEVVGENLGFGGGKPVHRD